MDEHVDIGIDTSTKLKETAGAEKEEESVNNSLKKEGSPLLYYSTVM